MALPIIDDSSAQAVFEKIERLAANTLRFAQETRAKIADGMSVPELLRVFTTIRASGRQGQAWAPTPGLGAYAKTQMGEAYDIFASFGAVMAAGTACTDWLIANLGDANGNIATQKFGADGPEIIVRSAADLEPLGRLLDSLIAAIVR